MAKLLIKKRILTFENLKDQFNSIFYYGSPVDSWISEIMLIPYITIGWNATPVWCRIIGPSSSGKTAHLSLLHDYEDTFVIDDMTSKSLISGYRSLGEDPSKLPMFDGKVILMSDESTMMEQRQEDRNIVQAILRKAYDGRVAKSFGNIKDVVECDAHFNMLAAATPAIDRYFSYTQALGERYINFRLQIPYPEELTKRAFNNQFSGYRDKHDTLKNSIHKFLTYFPDSTINNVSISNDIKRKLIICADFIARIRSNVSRDYTGKQITNIPRPENAGRLVQQLSQAAIAISLLYRKDRVSYDILDKVIYLAISSVSDIILYMLYTVYILSNGGTKPIVRQEIIKSTGFGNQTVSQILENFSILKVVKINKCSSFLSHSIDYTLSNSVKNIIDNLELFKYYRPPNKLLLKKFKKGK